MYLLKKKIFVSLMASLFTVPVIAQAPSQAPAQQMPSQAEPQKEELKKFAEAAVVVQEVSENLQNDMVAVIKEEGMEVERYQELMNAQKGAPSADGTTPSEAERESLSTVSAKIQEIQLDGQKKVTAKIEEAGLTVNRYQEIAAMVQQNPEMQKEVQGYMQ